MASVDIWYLFDLSMDFKANINFVARFHADITSESDGPSWNFLARAKPNYEAEPSWAL